MKTIRSKKLNTQISTICDFNSLYDHRCDGDTNPTSLGTDPTNTTVTIVTTVNTHLAAQRLTA